MPDRPSCQNNLAAYVAPALALLLSATPAALADPKPTTAPSSVVVPALAGPFNWVDRGPVVSAHVDPTHKVVSVKDPSVVFYQGRWHIYATYGREFGETDGRWGMVYFNFTD